MDDRGLIPGSGRDISVGHRVQTSTGPASLSYPVDTGVLSEKVKQFEVYDKSPCGFEVINALNYTVRSPRHGAVLR
jgi:hypothetical protein